MSKKDKFSRKIKIASFIVQTQFNTFDLQKKEKIYCPR